MEGLYINKAGGYTFFLILGPFIDKTTVVLSMFHHSEISRKYVMQRPELFFFPALPIPQLNLTLSTAIHMPP